MPAPKVTAPGTLNSMSGPPEKVGQAWLEQSTGAVGKKIEPQVTAAPPAAGNRANMGANVLKLINKTAEEKRNAIAHVGESAKGSVIERAPSDGNNEFSRTPSAQEVEKLKAEAEKVQNMDSNVRRSGICEPNSKVRVSIKYIKHLPKMDTWGKADAYCITVLDNKKLGGQKYKRKSKIVKKSYHPEFPYEAYDFDVKNYPEQEVIITVWDWDAGDEDDLIGEVKVPLAPLLEAKQYDHTYQVLGQDGQPITGHDGSSTIIKIVLEKDVTPASVGPDGVNIDSLVGDSEEIRTLVTPNWETAARGLMFDIENHSKYPVVVTRLEAQAGRGKGDGSAAYTIYHAVGKWNVQRCPCCRIAPCKFMKCCCGSCPSVRSVPNASNMQHLDAELKVEYNSA